MAEVEFAGINFKGGRAVVLVTALSTLGGGLWAGFEFYADYMSMKEIIQNIDTDAIDARNAVIETKLDEAIEYTRDIKRGRKGGHRRGGFFFFFFCNRMKDVQDDIDERLRQVSDISRETEKDVRDSLRDVEDRVDEKLEKLDNELRDTLQKALDNPLS